MAALDTNVLVRWLTNDHAEQAEAVEKLLHASLESGARLFVPVTVLLETEWVLRSRYRFDPAAIMAALDALLSVPELEIQEEAAVERALWLFKQESTSDLADCLHLGLAGLAAKGPLLTFDERASRLEGALLLTID